MIDHSTATDYKIPSEAYTSEPLRKDRYGKVRLYNSPGQPRKSAMKLAEWIDANEGNGKTREWVCEQMQVSASTVDKWCSGKVVPRPKRIAKIHELTDGQVTLRDWLKLEE